MECGYEKRRENELAVLARWFDYSKLPEGVIHPAQYLDIILYSKAQIIEENNATGVHNENENSEYDYGIISVKAQNVTYELPMQPITAMRNALGKDQGGSGVPFDPVKYNASVAFWEKHASVK